MENTENKLTSFKIRQVPHCVDIAMVIQMILTFGVMLSLKGLGEKDKTDVFIGTAIGVLFFIGVNINYQLTSWRSFKVLR